ncbi:MAG: formylglycine-generating enzyme family protein [Candidatus Brocadiaceae bacterium]|nr:formylglycine-generating enzyme family protein [Candidatus Brocadiaceae bacterium]
MNRNTLLMLLLICVAVFSIGKPVSASKEKNNESSVKKASEKGLPVAREQEEKYPDMVLIPAGEFIMGENTRYKWTFLLSYNIYDGPAHKVYLDAYYIDRYEVTNEQYRKFVEETGHRGSICWNDSRFNGPKKPVTGVTWDDAMAYAKWAGKRLPTEAEWEKAARGADNRLWPWGNEIFSEETCNVWETKFRKTTDVGIFEKGKSPYGCYDMAGNAWEWCADYYDQNYYFQSPSNNPKGPEFAQQKVIRGGSFLWFGHYARCSARYRVPHYARNQQIGFRCAKSLNEEK